LGKPLWEGREGGEPKENGVSTREKLKVGGVLESGRKSVAGKREIAIFPLTGTSPPGIQTKQKGEPVKKNGRVGNDSRMFFSKNTGGVEKRIVRPGGEEGG